MNTKLKTVGLLLGCIITLSVRAYPADWNPLAAGGTDTLGFFVNEIKANPEPLQTPRPARRLIAIDPGHPSSFNSGSAVINGTTEGHINWVVALKLQALLISSGVDAVLVKSSEMQLVENKERARIANRAGADLTVHLHCDAGTHSGFAIYYPDRRGVHTYKDDPENGFSGPSKAVLTGSSALGKAVFNGMSGVLAGKLRGTLRTDFQSLVGSRQGALATSIFSEIPTVTIEMAVLTNYSDALFLKSEQGQELMAKAIAAGILKY